MKSEFKVKFLQHINKKNQDKGFTLIELLVVVIIIGILAAIALPSLLSQTNKAKQAEARQNCGAMNRSQQAYYLERQTFATSILELGVGIKEQTENFGYTIVSPGTDGVQNQCTPVKPNLKTYTGRTYTTIQTNGESLTQALLCESDSPTQTALAVTASTCPTGSKDLGK